MAKAVKKPRKKASCYEMPEPLPEGEILIDIAKKQWKLGTSIGQGGFGDIYSAQVATEKSTKYPYVVKVEPHGNGPLFVEKHFYIKNAREPDVKEFMKKHNLKTFGMPIYLGSGSHQFGKNRYRFIVMEKFGTDIDKLCKEHKGKLPISVVLQICWQIMYVLEYIHELGYIHADIKGGNILLGASASNKNQAYLVDFGLATRFTTDTEFKPNPKKAHDGTMEYTSRDAHQGVPTRRGDLEVLGYNMIKWLGGTLPWESKCTQPKVVQEMKEVGMRDIPGFVDDCLKTNRSVVQKFLSYTNKLKFNEAPDYKKVRKLFSDELEKKGGSVDGPFDFRGARKRTSGEFENDEAKTVDQEAVPDKKPAKKRGKKQKEIEEGVKETEEVMTSAMKEVLARKKQKEAEKKKKPQSKKEKVNGEANGGDFDGYNAEMIEVKTRIQNNEKNGKGTRSPSSLEKEGGRPRRHVAAVNYNEATSPVMKRK